MINNRSVLVIIPARGGSKGLPRKNMKILNGMPLVGWPIKAALSSRYVDKIIVSTEDGEIAQKAVELGAEVPFLRPQELASDTASSFSVLQHVIDVLKSDGHYFDYIVMLESTSPLTESDDIDNALEKLESNRIIADAIVGVSEVESSHPLFCFNINERGLLDPLNKQKKVTAVRRQDISKLYFLEGSLYISSTDKLLENETFYHDRTLPYITPKWKSFEIDDIVDFICIEAIMNNMSEISK